MKPRPYIAWATWLAFLAACAIFVGSMIVDAAIQIVSEDYEP